MTDQGLPRAQRLHLKNDFKQIIHGGKRIQGNSLVLWYRPVPDLPVRRLGIVVSRKFGSAVMRNRAKRLLREAFRLNRENLPNGVDYIFSPRCSKDLATLPCVQQALEQLCRRAGLWRPIGAPTTISAEND